MSENETVILGVMDLAEAKRVRSVMSDKGIHIELVATADSCASPAKKCSVKAELHVRTEDVEQIVGFLQAERSKLFEDLNVNPEIHSQTFDTSQESAVCPACGTQFSTKLSECPDCGLVFVAEGMIASSPEHGE